MKVYVASIHKSYEDNFMEAFCDILGVFTSFEMAKETALSYALRQACGKENSNSSFDIVIDDPIEYLIRYKDSFAETSIDVTEQMLITDGD